MIKRCKWRHRRGVGEKWVKVRILQRQNRGAFLLFIHSQSDFLKKTLTLAGKGCTFESLEYNPNTKRVLQNCSWNSQLRQHQIRSLHKPQTININHKTEASRVRIFFSGVGNNKPTGLKWNQSQNCVQRRRADIRSSSVSHLAAFPFFSLKLQNLLTCFWKFSTVWSKPVLVQQNPATCEFCQISPWRRVSCRHLLLLSEVWASERASVGFWLTNKNKRSVVFLTLSRCQS